MSSELSELQTTADPPAPLAPSEVVEPVPAAPPIPAPPTVPEIEQFFVRPDWLSFTLTTMLVLAVYLSTLAPEVTLEMSGILATNANYGGVANPPGFPLWTWYAWVFTKLLPFSNVAWRIGVSSAVAGALACGVIALMVSRGGAAMLEGIRGLRRLEPVEERWLRVLCGAVAGMGFGFDGIVWGEAVIVNHPPLSHLVFVIMLCLLLRWLYSPSRKRYLYAAFLVYGLSVSGTQVLIPAAIGLPFFVMFGDRHVARDLFFGAAILAGVVLLAGLFDGSRLLSDAAGRPNRIWGLYLGIGLLSAGMCGVLALVTGRFFSTRRIAATAGLFAMLGVTPYLYLPLASMTTPPSNWGYARTVEGFSHLITRGQYESINPTGDFSRFLSQLSGYVELTSRDFGFVYALSAIVPFCFLRRMQARERGAMLGLLGFFLCLSALLLFLLNPSPDRQARELFTPYFAASHLVLALWAGFGLMLLGTIVARSRGEREVAV